MLVLRKEIKIGIGAGLSILGIVAVYGLIAALSSGPSDHSKDVTANVSTDENGNDVSAPNGGRQGLPPPDTGETSPASQPPPQKTPDPVKGRDPFTESVRLDGNTTTDPWATALSTGHLGNDSKPAVIKSPTPEGKSDVKLITFPTPGGDPNARLIADPPLQKKGDATAKHPPAPAAPATAGGSTYKIQAGDTFSTISAKVYGTKKYFAVLAKANPDVNPSRMKVGHEITVPPKEQVASVGGAIEPESAKLTRPIDASRQYRIAPGDTLSRIASKLYGKSAMWEDLYEKNKAAIGPDAARLKVGTVLDLPEKPTVR